MSLIKQLSSDVVNQIAAGEVVERPSHLVKELIENSLDAGAGQILVEVSEGGRFIKVVDNGQGIYSEDLDKALQRHATSKITKTNDLWNLGTFGFRGEALASAAAVSKLTLKSIRVDEKKPSQIESDFGKISKVKPSSISVGTEIKIENLFENVPARLKFLKTESAEFGQIKQVIKALALANPKTEFKLIQNGDLQLFYSKKTNEVDRVKDVLEKKQLFEGYHENGPYSCRVVFASPHEVAKTSKQIWIFAQGRWIQDRALQAAVMDAYRSLLMHGEYPHAVVWLNCQPEQIDVNIHPTKSQVKFQDASQAFRVVQGCLRKELEKAPWIVKSNSSHERADYGTSYVAQQIAYQPNNLSFHDNSFEQTQFKNKSYSLGLDDIAQLKIDNSVISSPAAVDSFKMSNVDLTGYWSSLQVIGQVNLTYIVAQKHDRIVYVDQHAAHERVAYETLMRAWKNSQFEIQSFLFPIAIDLSEEKVEVLMRYETDISKLGFTVEQLGPISIGVKSAPSLVKDSSLPLVFEKMANDLLDNGGSFAIEKKISDLFATMACHSVVRAGQSLSLTEMQSLLRSMDEFALSSFCPHGRPVSVETTFNDLERLFGRIN